jgi:DHA1 family bicyclomycin/chloramphenicol resistance-like MFS transporter
MDRSRNSLFVPILIAVAVLGPVAIQILLPALPAVQTAFGAMTGTVQLVLSVSMLALAVATLIYGPVSDRLGRRPVLLAALGLFLAGSAICAVAPRLWVLLVGRVIQAVGGAAGMVLSRAMARDRYGPENSAGIIAYLFIAIVIAPMPAPAIGGLLTDFFGWRVNFIFTGAIGLALFVAVLLGLDETLGERSSRSGLASMLAAYGTLLRSRAFLGYALQSAFTVGAFFAFISATPYIVVSVLGRPATEYGLYSLLVSAAMVIGNFGSTRLAAERDRLILWGSVLALLGSAVGLALALRGLWTPVAVFAPGVLLALGCGLSLPGSVAGAIAADPEAAGSASGLSSFLQLAASAVFAQAAGTWQSGTPAPMSACATIATAIALLSFIGLIRPRVALAY